MTVLQTRINTRETAFADNREHMRAQVDDLRRHHEATLAEVLA